jgi:two-component system, OmpR family, sensor kinase
MTTPHPRGAAGVPARWRRWLAGRTLRARLIAGLLILFTLASVGVGVATAAAMGPFLIDRLDQQLAAASSALSPGSAPSDGQDSQPRPAPAGPPGEPNMAGQAVHTFGACLNDGRITRYGLAAADYEGSVSQPPLSGADIAALRALRPGSAASVHLSAIGDYRLVATSPGDGTVNIAGLPLTGVQTTLRELELIEIVVFGAALLIIAVAGTAWVRLSLRPLGRITATAAAVSRLPLDSGEVTLPHRAPGADPRTEVGQLGEAFNLMLGHVEASLATRQASEARLRQFIADASHELRTPLAGIRGYTELALRDEAGLHPELRRALGRVDAESLRMSRLVDDLLLLARLDAGRPLAHEQVDLTRLAIDATNDARVAGPGHQWILDLPDEPVTVTGDQHRLHQVLANLLTNARTHTPPGTKVTVHLARAGAAMARDGSEGAGDGAGSREGVTLSVGDDGPGIPADLQQAVWERFTRGDSARSRKAGSTGLGLAIVAAVVSAHRGRVSLASRPGRTTFTIWLPD